MMDPAKSQPLIRRVLMALVVAAWLVAIPVIYFWPGWGRPADPTAAPGARLAFPAPESLLHAGAAALIFLAAVGAGALPARWLAPDRRGVGRALVVLALGMGVMSTAALGLAALGALRPVPLTVILVALAVAGTVTIVRALRRAPRTPLRVGAPDIVGITLLLIAGAFAGTGALAPEIEYDALWYHLGIPALWLRDGGLTDLPCQFVGAYPYGTEMIYAYGLAVDGPIAAKLVHFGFAVLLILAIYDLGRRLFSPRAALAGAVVAATAPTILWESTTAYIDLATAFLVVVALDFALAHAEAPMRRKVVACAVMAALGVTSKLLTLIALPPLALLIFAGPRRRPARARFLDIAVLGAAVLLPALPWLIRAEVLYGNPVLPSLYGVFGADPERWSSQAEAGLNGFFDKFGTGSGLGHFVMLPWNLTMHAAAFGACFGVLLLLLVPLAIRRRPSRLSLLAAVFCLGYTVLWFSPISSQQGRFLIPVAAVLAPFAGAGLERVARAAGSFSRFGPAVPIALAAALAFLSLPQYVQRHERDRHGWDGWLTGVLRETPFPLLTRAETEESFLRRRVRQYGAERRIAAAARPGDRVVAFGDPDNLYAGGAEMIPDFAVCLNQVRAARGDDPAMLDAMRRSGVRFVLWDRRRGGEQPDLAFAHRNLRLVYRDSKSLLFDVPPQ